MNEFVKKLNLDNETMFQLENLDKEDILPLEDKRKTNGLSDDQNNGMDAILNWLYNYKGSRNEDNFFALRGSAGTGKTTLLGVLLKSIDNMKYRSSRICICAPTHKAKKVISVKTGWRNSETLQALLGLKMDINLDDFDPNSPAFSQIGDRKIKDYDLVLIDESSMVNTELYKTIVECANQSGTMILFIGDTLQLNPVKEYNISPALTAPIHSYTLTQIMRQGAGNPLIELLDILREDIKNGTANYLDILKGKPTNINEIDGKSIGYIMTKDSNKFAEYMTEVFQSQEFENEKNHCRYISWTNDSITSTNRWLRTKVFSCIDTIQKDEILLSYKTVVKDDDTIIVNSDDYRVLDVTDSIVSDYEYPLQVHVVKLEGIDTGAKTTIILLKRDAANFKHYQYVYNDILMEAQAKKGKAWRKFFEFKAEVLVSEDMVYNNPVLHKDEKIKKDVDFGYGITIHKSQGSTYNTVLVNGKNINNNPNDIERKRLWYVALSRASEKAYIIL